MNRTLAIDIGANAGTKTSELLDMGFAHVVSVDPLYGSPFPPEEKRVTWLKTLVSDSFESRMIYPLGTISTCSEEFMAESRFAGQVWGAPVLVPSTTLRDLIERYGNPDYIKIDVENHELQVLAGLPPVVEVPLISFEWHSEFRDNALACVKLLASMGYSKFQLNFEDSIIELDKVVCTRSPDEVMTDFDAMCETRHAAWGQIFCQL